jgi:hypothetical protein
MTLRFIDYIILGGDDCRARTVDVIGLMDFPSYLLCNLMMDGNMG